MLQPQQPELSRISMKGLPVPGALVWVEYTQLNCYWPCVVEKYNEEKVKIGSIPLSLKEYDWVKTETMRYPFLAYLDGFASKSPPATMSLHGKYSPAVEEALQLELKRLGCPSPRIEYATRARSFDQRLLLLKALVKNFAPSEDWVKSKDCERLGDLFSSVLKPESQPKAKARNKSKAKPLAGRGKSSSSSSNSNSSTDVVKSSSGSNVISSSSSENSSNIRKSHTSSSGISSSRSSSSGGSSIRNSSSINAGDGRNRGSNGSSGSNIGSSSSSSSAGDWVPLKNETVFFLGCDLTKMPAGNAIVKRVTYSREGSSPIKLELFFAGCNLTATYPLNLVRSCSLGKGDRGQEQPQLSPPIPKKSDRLASEGMPLPVSGKSDVTAARRSDKLQYSAGKINAQSNSHAAAPLSAASAPHGIGSHVLTGGAFGGSEKLARVITISEADVDSDDSDDDDGGKCSGIGLANSFSGGSTPRKKLYELLFSDDGATLSKEWTSSQFEKAAAAAQAYKVRQDQHRNMVSALSAKDGLPSGLAVGSLIPKKVPRGSTMTSSSTTKSSTAATANIASTNSSATATSTKTTTAIAAAAKTTSPTASKLAAAATTTKTRPPTAATKSKIPATNFTPPPPPASAKTALTKPAIPIAAHAITSSTPTSAATVESSATASSVDIRAAPWQNPTTHSLPKEQRPGVIGMNRSIAHQESESRVSAAATINSRVPYHDRDPRIKKPMNSHAPKTTVAPAPYLATHAVAAMADTTSVKDRQIAATSPPAAAISALASLAAAASAATRPDTDPSAPPPPRNAVTDHTTDMSAAMPSAVAVRKISRSPSRSTASTDTWVASDNESPMPATPVSLGSDDDIDNKSNGSKTDNGDNGGDYNVHNNGTLASTSSKRKRQITASESKRSHTSSNDGHHHRAGQTPVGATLLEGHWCCSYCSCNNSVLRRNCSLCQEMRLTERNLSAQVDYSSNHQDDTRTHPVGLTRGASLSSLFLASEKAAAMVAAGRTHNSVHDSRPDNQRRSGTPDGLPPSQESPLSGQIAAAAAPAEPSLSTLLHPSRDKPSIAADVRPGQGLIMSSAPMFEVERHRSSASRRERSRSRDSRHDQSRSREYHDERSPSKTTHQNLSWPSASHHDRGRSIDPACEARGMLIVNKSKQRRAQEFRRRQEDRRRQEEHFQIFSSEIAGAPLNPSGAMPQDWSRSNASHCDRSRSNDARHEVHGTDKDFSAKVRKAQEFSHRRENLSESRRRLSSESTRLAHAPVHECSTTKQPASVVLCRNWKAIGRCDMGDRCRFAHRNIGDPKGPREENKMGPFIKSRRLCKFWNTRDGCFKGDKCEFLHHGSDLYGARESDKIKEVKSFHEAMDFLERARSSETAT